METKFCGNKVAIDAVVCTSCGKQIEKLKTEEGNSTSPVVINNVNNVNNVSGTYGTTAIFAGKKCNKWVALLLCICLGYFGAHKFYEGKIGQGILYLFTGGLCGIGVIIDFISILCKPVPYYV